MDGWIRETRGAASRDADIVLELPALRPKVTNQHPVLAQKRRQTPRVDPLHIAQDEVRVCWCCVGGWVGGWVVGWVGGLVLLVMHGE
jgi:hypothetical protein